MNTKNVQRIIEKHAQRLSDELQLFDWDIKFEVSSEDPNGRARISYQNEYQRATITINPDLAEDEECVVRSIRHELLHLLHAEFWLCIQQAENYLSETEYSAINDLYNHAAERTVMRIERALDKGIKWPVTPEHKA